MPSARPFRSVRTFVRSLAFNSYMLTIIVLLVNIVLVCCVVKGLRGLFCNCWEGIILGL